MNLKPIVIAVAASLPLVATSQINSNQSVGYVARAAAMLNDGNMQGCIDQCNIALELGVAEREQIMWLRAVATFREDYASSAPLLRAFIAQFPAGAQVESAKLLLATIPFYDEDYATALKALKGVSRNALQLNEADDLDYRTAYCQIKLGQFDAARLRMGRLSKSKVYGDAATFYLAYIAYAQGDYELARQMFDDVNTQKAPGNLAPYYIAQIDFKEKNYSRVLTILSPLISQKNIPDEYLDEAQRLCGESIFATTGNDRRAMDYLAPYMERHSDDAPLSARYVAGISDYQSGKYNEAISLLAPVSELTDEMGQSAALTIGQAYLAQGNSAAALIQFEKATRLDFDPKITELAYYNYAVAQVDGGRIPFGNSVQTLEEFIKRYPQSSYAATVQDYLVKGYMSTDDYEGALRSLNALKNSGTQIQAARQQVNFVLGTRALQSGRVAQAIQYIEEAQKYSKYNADIARQANLWLADAYYESGKYSQAEKLYSQFLSTAPQADTNRLNAQYNLAYSLFGQKNYTKARSAFQSALSRKSVPTDIKTDCLNRIGDTYYYGKDFGAALKSYKEAYDSQPQTGDYSLLQIAIMEGHLERLNEKIENLNRLINSFPNSSLRPAAMNEKALTQAAQGKTSEALSTYGEIATSYPNTAQGRNAFLQLAILQRTAGNTSKAKEYYLQVISKFPTSSEAALAVQDLKVIYGNEGEIEVLNSFLESVKGAPQLDAVERNAIAASALLKKAKTATSTSAKLDASLQLLEKYPDAEGAEEALAIAAQCEYEQGLADRALSRFTLLEARASSPTIRQTARMGILRTARDMGNYDKVLSTSSDILSSSAIASADIPEVKFIRAEALRAKGNTTEATQLWSELAKTPANIFGTRAAYELANSAFNRHSLQEAANFAEELIDANPPHPYWLARTFILYSDILRARGSDFEADEYLRALRSNYPGTDADIFQMIDSRLNK